MVSSVHEHIKTYAALVVVAVNPFRIEATCLSSVTAPACDSTRCFTKEVHLHLSSALSKAGKFRDILQKSINCRRFIKALLENCSGCKHLYKTKCSRREVESVKAEKRRKRSVRGPKHGGEFRSCHFSALPIPPHQHQLTCIMSNAQQTGHVRRSRATLTKQACDACKTRKVKCTYDESVAPTATAHRPCRRCTRLAIDCTFTVPQKCRGPRRRRTDVRCVDQSFDLSECCSDGSIIQQYGQYDDAWRDIEATRR